MSQDHHEEEKNPISNLIGVIFMVVMPAALIAMLALTGFAFVGDLRAPKTAAAKPDAPSAPGGVETPGTPGAPAAPAGAMSQMELGAKAYATCAACHGPDGKGMQVGPQKMAPTLVGSEMVLGDPDQSLLIILKGIQKENNDYLGVMATLAAALDDEKLAAVLTYTRNSWGNKAEPVTVEQARAAREKFAAVDAPVGVKRDEIPEIVKQHGGE